MLSHRRLVCHWAGGAIQQGGLELEDNGLTHLDRVSRLDTIRIAGNRHRGVARIPGDVKGEPVRNRNICNRIRIPPSCRQDVFNHHVKRRGQTAVGHNQINDDYAIGG